MARLPQLDRPFLTDAGLETDIIFNHGIDLPYFASITLLASDEGRAALEAYFSGFVSLAERVNAGLILESATWRAGPDWAVPLGYSEARLEELNQAAIAMLIELRDAARGSVSDLVVSGCIGPRGDGYDPGRITTVDEAADYHRVQAGWLAAAGADMLSAITMTNVPEAVGITRAAKALDMPVAVSFTVETDGRLPTGEALGDAIVAVDRATGDYPAYYMINCAHPDHYAAVLGAGESWVVRIGGMRANASRCSHAELDAMTELDCGDPAELAALYGEIRQRWPQINVLGGCCGTDLRHVTAIAETCLMR